MLRYKIKSLRKERGLTLQELANLSGSNKSYIWELENPRHGRKAIQPSVKKIKAIASALGVDFQYLLNDDLPIYEKDKCYLAMFRTLTEDQKDVVLRIVKSLKGFEKEVNNE